MSLLGTLIVPCNFFEEMQIRERGKKGEKVPVTTLTTRGFYVHLMLTDDSSRKSENVSSCVLSAHNGLNLQIIFIRTGTL